MRVILIAVLLSTIWGFPKKQIQQYRPSKPMVASDVKMSDVDLALYQNDVSQTRNHLNSEITNWVSAKETMLTQLSVCYSYFEMFVTKQQQIGILLVCIICFAFYLVVKSEDRNLKQRKNLKKRPLSMDPPVQILTESLMKEQAQISTILGIATEERVNKSADDAQRKLPKLQRSSSQPIIQHPDQSAEEITSLLRDIV